MSQNEGIFYSLPIFWKILIIIGSITVFITFILIIVLLSLFCGPKLELEADIREYNNFLDEFENGSINIDTEENKDIIIYPNLPKIKDLKGDILLDLMKIDIVDDKIGDKVVENKKKRNRVKK